MFLSVELPTFSAISPDANKTGANSFATPAIVLSETEVLNVKIYVQAEALA